MPILSKSKSGMLLYEDFTHNSLIWNPSPNDYTNIEFGDFGLLVKASKDYKMFTIQEPIGDYSFICKLNHVPKTKKDIAGVVLISNAQDYIECQSCVMDGPSTITNSNWTQEVIENYVEQVIGNYVQYEIEGESTEVDPVPPEPIPPEQGEGTFVDIVYPYIKVEKSVNTYTFYASKNGTAWEEVGNASGNMSRIGFFLYGESTTDLNVKYAAIYDNNFVTIEGVNSKDQVEVYDGETRICSKTDGNVMAGKNRIVIDTTNLLMPLMNGTIKLIHEDGSMDSLQANQMVGGDIYSLFMNVGLFIENKEVFPDQLFDIGTFYTHDQTVKLDIYNREEKELTNIKVKVSAYSVYYGGEENVLISL